MGFIDKTQVSYLLICDDVTSCTVNVMGPKAHVRLRRVVSFQLLGTGGAVVGYKKQMLLSAIVLRAWIPNLEKSEE